MDTMFTGMVIKAAILKDACVSAHATTSSEIFLFFVLSKQKTGVYPATD